MEDLKVGSVVRFTDYVLGHNFKIVPGVFGEVIRGRDQIYDGHAKVIGLSFSIPILKKDVKVIPDGSYE